MECGKNFNMKSESAIGYLKTGKQLLCGQHLEQLLRFVVSHWASLKRRDGGLGGLVAKLCPTLAIPWTVACQAPLSMGFSRQEYWSGLPFPSPGDRPNPGNEPGSPALQADGLPTK